jgi:hypothetical protein
MTPKEKARELLDKYLNPFNRNGCIPPYETMFKSTAKQCALIAVDEIIYLLDRYIDPVRSYWEDVKREINKL